MSDLETNVERVGDALVVSVRGEITLAQTPSFHQSLVTLCAQTPRILVVDLSAVPYMDSSGVGTLVDIYRKIRARGCNMALVGLTDTVRSLFEITKLDSFFTILPTRDEAIKS